MDSQLPQHVQDGLDAARKAALRRASKLRICAGDAQIPVLRSWDKGFAVEAAQALALRGRVDLYHGARLLSQCLIIASEQEGGEIRFEYKQMTDATETQPLDFHRSPDAPVALLAPPTDY